MYYERHINGKVTPATHSVFLDSMKEEMAKIKERGANAGNVSFSGWQTKIANVATEASNIVREFFQKKNNRSLVYGMLAGAGIVGTTAGTVAALNNNEEQESPHASARIA